MQSEYESNLDKKNNLSPGQEINPNPIKNNQENYRKHILQLAVPVIVEQLMVMALGMINVMMVGHISKEATAAMNMIDMLSQVIISFFSSLAVGGTVIVARLVGQRDFKSISHVTKQSLYAGSILSLLVTLLLVVFQKPLLSLLYADAEVSVVHNALNYFHIVVFAYPCITLTLVIFGILRGAGDTKSPMKITFIMNVLNVFFSYILIYGLELNLHGLKIDIPALHIKGAALGIGIAYLTGAAIALHLVFGGTQYIKLRPLGKFHFDKEVLSRMFKVGFPAGLEQILMNGGKLILLTVIVGMGTASIAAHSIGMSLMSLLFMPLTGFSIASTTLIGQSLGKSDPYEAELITNKVIKLAMLMMLPVATIIFIFPGFFYNLYTFDKEVIKIGSKIVRIFIIAFPFHILSMIIAGSLRGAGDTRYCAFSTFLGVWGFRLLLGYILGVIFHLGIYGVWVGIGLDLIIRSSLFYIRYKKGKWRFIQV